MRTLERLMTLNRMRNAGLDWGLTGEYSTERLNACCDLLEQEADGPRPVQTLPGYAVRAAGRFRVSSPVPRTAAIWH